MQTYALLPGLILLVNLVASVAAGRVVQLITENPSAFVAADPNDPQYVVALFDEDHQPSELPTQGLLRSMLMTDAAGQRYNCTLPGAPSQFASVVAAQQQPAGPAAALQARSPFELLDSLTGLCLYRQDGLWTYEVCHKKHVRQFRQATKLGSEGTAVIKITGASTLTGLMQAVEAGDMAKAVEELESLLGGEAADSAKGKEDFSCGQYSGDDQQVEAVLEDASSSGHHIKYVSHTFSGGANCLLTGAPRTAEVRYTCARDVKENVVLSVREFPTCNYVVVVSTPFLCKHPVFTPPVHDVRLISCLPVDDQGQAVTLELKSLAAAEAAAQGESAGGAGLQLPKVTAGAPVPHAAATPAGTEGGRDAAADGIERATSQQKQEQVEPGADHDEL